MLEKSRLRGGAHPCVGRLEVYHGNEWGIVCVRKPNEATSKVVCRQLRCGNVEEMNSGVSFGRDPPHKVWLDDVTCHGNESSLFHCSSVNWGVHECNSKTNHFNIKCSEHIKVSLADGEDRCAGRVEIAYQGKNGTICPTNWGQREANLVCREVDCGEALSFGRGALFGLGAGPVWINDLSCGVEDEKIWGCGRMTNRNCKDEEKAASVVCRDHIDMRLAGREDACSGTLEIRKGKDLLSTCPPEIDLTDPDKICEKLRCGNATSSGPINCAGSNLTCSGSVHVSLVDKQVSHCYGTVRINHTGQEGAVCSNNWDLKAGTVVCKSMGCGEAVSVYSTQGGGPVFLDYLRCNGDEKHLWHCGALRPTQENCQHAAVICSDSVKTRLMDGQSPCAGRVEVFYHGEWGTVCNEDWDSRDTRVLCAELNCGEVQSFHQAPVFRRGQGKIWRSRVNCSSTETSLQDCPADTEWGQNHCSHNQDVRVVCGEHKKLQLARGTSCSGAVEIFSRGSWVGLSGASWEQAAAEVVCRQLHCGNAVSKEVKGSENGSSRKAWSHWFNCLSTEDNVFRCRAEKLAKSDPKKDGFAYVNCSGSVSVNLTGLDDRCAGLVEVCLGGSCGSVCGRDWSTKESQVVCQELGCGMVAKMLDDFTVVTENTPLLLDFVSCTGNETFLGHCNLLKEDAQQCQSGKAKVVCSDSIKPRLAGDEGRCAGTVEAYHSGKWWSVCDQKWSKEAGDVVCKELGCGLAVETHTGAYYGPGSGQGWVNIGACQGNEDSFSQCISPDKGEQCLGQAGVRCSEHREISLQGPEPCSGRVIIHYNDSWSPMCSDQWGQSQADQLCQHLRCGKAKSVHNDTTLQGYSKWLRYQPCTDSKPWECPLELADCRGETAHVKCTDTVKATLSEKCSGRPRLARNGRNERVCGRNWGMTQARVLCKELDCGTALWTVWDSRYQNNNTLDATVDHVRCSGGEPLLWKCRALSIPPKTCSAADDITVVCAAGFKVRLTEGCGGRLQVNLRGIWEDACPMNLERGDLVCKKLGCGALTKTEVTTNLAGKVSLKPYLNCTQNCTELWQCVTEKNCRLGEHTLVYCSEHRTPFIPLPLILAFVVILAVLLLVYPLVRLYKCAVLKINATKRESVVSDSVSDYECINTSGDEQSGTELKRFASSERRARSDEEDSQDQCSSFVSSFTSGDVDVEKRLVRFKSDKESDYDDVSDSLNEANPDADLQWRQRDQEGYPPPPGLDTQLDYDDVAKLSESGHPLSEPTGVGDLGQTAGGDGETLDGTGDPVVED
ncbi:deleted in malignant brain tumors 1 protein-like [Polyodon spathula]|uniref:deleted in malignant brain tumors 1 protein-like n=1 Tax=Polyodon spathula TaxID=7913 RepID=UPI001B7DE9E9|nr:deleted in malignant brain tumors 1 protein-like [Polyodon spathula]